MPDEQFKDDEIIYQWATFSDKDPNSDLVYSVACKTTVGEPDATRIELFVGDTSMKNDSEAIVGKTWDK